MYFKRRLRHRDRTDPDRFSLKHSPVKPSQGLVSPGLKRRTRTSEAWRVLKSLRKTQNMYLTYRD